MFRPSEGEEEEVEESSEDDVRAVVLMSSHDNADWLPCDTLQKLPGNS